MDTVGLFAGIGGLEIGLNQAGFTTTLMCEIDPAARQVLNSQFDGVDTVADVRKLRALPTGTELVAAGFPCQDLSQAGRTAGITGSRSGLVGEVFRLIKRKQGPKWLLLENVPFMLQLDRGAAMHHLTQTLTELGYRWAYRVVDARSFGLPQRRHRVVMLASRSEDPRAVLFSGNAQPPTELLNADDPCGFYWTEGRTGLGWAVNGVPTIKSGSTVGIASPPAVWLPGRGIVTLGINGAERLQGFPVGWTLPAIDAGARAGSRWRLVGNAVSTRMSKWVGEQLIESHQPYDGQADIEVTSRWPTAAWGDKTGSFIAGGVTSLWPEAQPLDPIEKFLEDSAPLSPRATAGFLKRAKAGSLRFAPNFLAEVENHLDAMTTTGMTA
ncbi:DNA (cytosine-5-)-methyltransferase [Rhodococcus sp. 06-470-2]|uniref:DNA cytosine methyltransferase n=1 Tax=unclassified Rhodococcus (in: high G+C Gram-positive bacteria) TaxID=192944 RepID=UPI000B9AC24F|nr:MULTISPECIES: DNA (cytosine-5-)-methyltransferase [unclassified Rhodococcus (in: high G+C Gram-positive bacteria)]OZC63300.1 DNA (cytosine-5-)-methyltransferase [Rhodococcus sp. 06-470-2]OZE61320.1 DNA (cytosine-5-)-methyltransferase [Rhodococcus sp. 05-2221-1B]